MTRRLFQLSVVAALILAVGGHWTALQSVAWVSMAVTYAKTAPLSVALKKTFDGEHPCRLCLAVKKGQRQESQREMIKIEAKLDFLCLQQFAYHHPALPLSFVSPRSEVALPRAEAPPTPPPRLA